MAWHGAEADAAAVVRAEACSRLSEHSPFYDQQGAGGPPTLDAVAAWITEGLRQDSDMAGAQAGGREGVALCRQAVPVLVAARC